jgi:hypothetical protein
MTADINAVHTTVQRIAEEGKEMVVLMHSYGGFPGGSGIEGLSYKDRAQAGKTGGVISIIYLTAMPALKGKS